MAVFLGLYLGHILGDFAFQPGRLVLAKRKHLKAVLLHTSIVTACTALVMAGQLAGVWLAVLLTGLAHLGVEQLTIRARRAPSASGLAVFVLDQGLHVLSMVLIAMLLGEHATPMIGLWRVSTATMVAVCGVTTVALAGSIFVFEVQMVRRPLDDGPDPVLGLDLARIYGMVERAGALIAALLLPMPALGALAFLPRLAYALASPAERRHRSLSATAAGLSLCAVAWGLVMLLGPTK